MNRFAGCSHQISRFLVSGICDILKQASSDWYKSTTRLGLLNISGSGLAFLRNFVSCSRKLTLSWYPTSSFLTRKDQNWGTCSWSKNPDDWINGKCSFPKKRVWISNNGRNGRYVLQAVHSRRWCKEFVSFSRQIVWELQRAQDSLHIATDAQGSRETLLVDFWQYPSIPRRAMFGHTILAEDVAECPNADTSIDVTYGSSWVQQKGFPRNISSWRNWLDDPFAGERAQHRRGHHSKCINRWGQDKLRRLDDYRPWTCLIYHNLLQNGGDV